VIASAGESRPPHVSAWASYHSTPRPSCGLWRERHPTELWHARRILEPRPGASLPHFQRPLGPTARHSWGELLVRPAHGYGISASRPFALPLIFIGGYEHPTAAGRALAAIPYDPGLQAKRDATAELLADAGR